MPEKSKAKNDRFPECIHFWEIIDKWTDSEGTIWWEFYCKNCMAIEVRHNKDRRKSSS